MASVGSLAAVGSDRGDRWPLSQTPRVLPDARPRWWRVPIGLARACATSAPRPSPPAPAHELNCVQPKAPARPAPQPPFPIPTRAPSLLPYPNPYDVMQSFLSAPVSGAVTRLRSSRRLC